MAPDKHPNDDYVNPPTRTAAAPIPPDVRPDDLRAQLDAEQEAADKAAEKARKTGEPVTAESVSKPADESTAAEPAGSARTKSKS